MAVPEGIGCGWTGRDVGLGMFTEETSASPLTLTAREQVPKFADLLWHCFGGASTSRKSRGLRYRLLRPDRAPIRHIGKKPLCPFITVLEAEFVLCIAEDWG